MRKFCLFLLSAILAVATTLAANAASDDVVRLADIAFPAQRAVGQMEISVRAEIAPGWHINSNTPHQPYLVPTELTVAPAGGISVLEVRYPPAVRKKVGFEDAPIELFEGLIEIAVSLKIDPAARSAGSDRLTVKLKYQACDAEKCLPPQTVERVFDLPVEPAAAPPTPLETAAPQKNIVNSMFQEKGILLTLFAIFLGGLALNLTPCVYPMIPITIAIFTGGRQKSDARSAVLQAVAYFLGIVVTYSVIGTVAGLTGGFFGSVLQQPPVLIGLALLLVYMAFAMFGWVPFGLPWAAQRLSTGNVPLGSFGLGATMGLVAAPCIGPFVVGLLAYVGQRQSPALGFTLFAVLSAGLGFPYLLLGLASSRLRSLPKLGEWMDAVKWGFGFALLGMAVYFISPLISDAAAGRLYALLLSVSAFTVVLFCSGRGPWKLAAGIVLAGALLAAAWKAQEVPPPVEEDGFWIEYDSYGFEGARAAGHPVLLDFYAEWCAPCKQLDRETWSDPRVRQAVDRAVRLKVDLTLFDSPHSAEARKQFGITGVPTAIYIDGRGRELLRYEGFFTPDAFLGDFKNLSREDTR